MEPGLVRDALTLLAGVATGVLSGAFGVGGGTISTPAIRALGLPALLAVGTTLPSIFPSALAGSVRYSRERLVDWRAVRLTTPPGVAAAVGGALLSRVVPGEGHLLMVLTALLLALAAHRLGTGRAGAGPDGRAGRAGSEAAGRGAGLFVALGVAAGLMSGLLGLGGGIVMVPGFAEVVGFPLKKAIATSLVCVGIFAVPGTVTHAALGGIDWRFALLLAAGVVPGARLGAAATIRAEDARLRLSVAAFLGVVAAVYLVTETAALLGT